MRKGQGRVTRRNGQWIRAEESLWMEQGEVTAGAGEASVQGTRRGTRMA